MAVRAIAETAIHSLPALVISPASVLKNWAREIRTWAPGLTTEFIEDGTGAIPPLRDPFTVYIISWALIETRRESLLRMGFRTIIADEAHYAKNPDTQRSQALFALCRRVQHVLLLTGTPIVNNQAEMEVLESVLGTKSPPMIRRLIEDVAPDIPEKKRAYAYIDILPEQRAEYDKADEDFGEWLREEKTRLLEDGFIESEIERTLGAEALTKLGYLRRLLGEAKIPAAVDWIARAVRVGEPVVVFLEHQAVLKKLVKGLRQQRIRCGVLDGNTSPGDRQALVDRFQRHEFPVFVGSRAAKEGITLTAARNLLFVERFFTSADEEQAEDRIRRIGQKNKTTIWYLHAVDTVDERIDAIVRAKRQVIRTAIGAEDIVESSETNVQSLLSAWFTCVSDKTRQVLPLGQGDPLAKLPTPRDTHAVVFTGDRWDGRSAYRWCKMHGYRAEKLIPMAKRFKLVVHPAQVFRSGKFALFHVARDVKLITGKRLSRTNERKVRRSLAGER